MLPQGEIAAPGSTFTLNPGVINSAERVNGASPGCNVIGCDGIPATGTSRRSDTAWASRSRTHAAPSGKIWRSNLVVSNTLGATVGVNVCSMSEAPAAPNTNDASTFCPTAAVVRHITMNQTTNRFTKSSLFCWLVETAPAGEHLCPE